MTRPQPHLIIDGSEIPYVYDATKLQDERDFEEHLEGFFSIQVRGREGMDCNDARVSFES